MNSNSKTPGIGRPRRAKESLRIVGLVVVLGIALSVVPGCKDPTTPVANIGSIVANNRCGAVVDIYLEGVFRAAIADDTSVTVPEIIPGTRLIQAFLQGTQDLVAEQTFTVEAAMQYQFYIDGVATISVTNQFGEILKIYLDGAYVGDIGNNITQTIHKVPFGTRALVAKRRSDDTEAATASIEVIAIADYPWIIIP